MWVHYHLRVDRRRFLNHWAGMTRSIFACWETLARSGDWVAAGVHLRKASSIYDIWKKQTGQRPQSGMDDFTRLLVDALARSGGG